MNNPGALTNKVIIVTGGNGLLGKAIVKAIREKGGLPVNIDLHGNDNLEEGLVHCDITNDREIRKKFEQIYNHYGKIDGLVNNAYPRTSDWGTDFEDIDPASWRTNIDWQLNSYFVCTQEVIKYMKPAGKGSIVFITSIYGIVGNDFTIYENTSIVHPAAYTVIKGGLISFSRYLAAKFGPYGIRSNCVSPGGIFDNQPEPFVKAYEKKVPLKRLGNPDDIGAPVAFILSDEAKYITGHNLMVDGGWTAI